MTKSVFTENYTYFLNLLIAERKSKKITQSQLALKINKTQSYVSKYENNERRIDVIEFVEIAKAVKVSPVKIIKNLIDNWK